MKSYIQNNKLIFKVDEDPARVVEKILKTLKELVRICESRTVSSFPVSEIKKLVDFCNALISKVDDINLPMGYVEYVNTQKESLGYFKQIEEEWREAERNLSQKKNLFKKFKNNVKSYADTL